jgi:L-asparaginase
MTVDPARGGNVPSLSAEDILGRTPGLDAIADVVPIDRGRTPASHFSFPDLLAIAALLRETLADPGLDGAVVVQGTDTIEETAFLWDLVLDTPKPVVVTGAMRSASESPYDGPANLRDAVRVAASPELRGEGVLVVLGGSIEPADTVVKTHTSSLETFRSLDAGPLGRVARDEVVLHRRRGPRRHVATTRAVERVHLVTAHVAMDGSLVDAAVASGADGFVVAATGAGNTSALLLAACERAMAAGASVVLASRCPAGAVHPGYAFPGGGATWANAGAILAGHLSAPKARVALALGLGGGLDRRGLAALLADPMAA